MTRTGNGEFTEREQGTAEYQTKSSADVTHQSQNRVGRFRLDVRVLQLREKHLQDNRNTCACQTRYSNTTVYYGMHEYREYIPVDSGVTNLIHDRRSCVDFTLEVRRMWIDVPLKREQAKRETQQWVMILWEGPAPPRISGHPQNRKWLWMTS